MYCVQQQPQQRARAVTRTVARGVCSCTQRRAIGYATFCVAPAVCVFARAPAAAQRVAFSQQCA
eukprot:1545646-Lingulodinium_polyedra.AAC.1